MNFQEKRAICSAFQPFGTTIFTEINRLSALAGAINLSQGFPDFDGPQAIRRIAAEHILEGPNQYCPPHGVPSLREAISRKVRRFYGVEVDPEREITVTCGATEAISSALLGLLEPGDEVILFEPCYDLYPPLVARAGAKAVYVPLERPEFHLPHHQLKQVFGPKTRLIIINNPLNPIGKVFSREELEFISGLCQHYDVIALSDEVYEHIVYDGREHIPLFKIPALRDRSLVISSTAKTFSMTGWKIGYSIGRPWLTEAVRMAHQFLTFCTPSALQEAMARAMDLEDDYYENLLALYTKKRELLSQALEDLGLRVLWPEGAYYTCISIDGLGFEDDMAFCRYLIDEVGIAAIPCSYFWHQRRGGRDLVRFCFCKTDDVLDQAIERLKRWRR